MIEIPRTLDISRVNVKPNWTKKPHTPFLGWV